MVKPEGDEGPATHLEGTPSHSLGAFPALMESKPGLSLFLFTRFVHANRPPPDEAGYGR